LCVVVKTIAHIFNGLDVIEEIKTCFSTPLSHRVLCLSILLFILNEKIEDSYWAAIQKNRKGRGRNAELNPVDPGGMKSKFCKNS
jgi:hypothetical protein